jgi:hypothetical protein
MERVYMSSHPRPFYYLENFSHALDWLKSRYVDLLLADELAFIDTVSRLPQESAALLVRMVMRQGPLFRTSQLQYAEIGPTDSAAEALVALGWVDPQPALSLQQLCAVLRRDELQAAFSLRRPPKSLDARSSRQLALSFRADEPRTLERWWKQAPDRVLHLSVAPLCERLRLMFFGDFHQDWAAFVLVELGIQRYETVRIDAAARAFRTREQIDHFQALYRLRELLHAEATAEDVFAAMPPPLAEGGWIEARRSKLLFLIGQAEEKAGRRMEALAAYQGCAHPHARIRSVRVLERLGKLTEAADMLSGLEANPASELEKQHAARIRPRLMRKLRLQPERSSILPTWPSFELQLALADPPRSVERVVRDHLSAVDAPVFYVENALINSLFGLLFWDAIFAPVCGAFFHPFHSAPVDLLEADFRARRESDFDAGFAKLDSGTYGETLLTNFDRKRGIQSPFVAWGLVTRQLLSLAIDCLPPTHLRSFFDRLLADLRAHRTGLPDLIQFFPGEKRYRMIEVKGPGDRLQDNQVGWLSFCVAKRIPVEVCNLSSPDAAQ